MAALTGLASALESYRGRDRLVRLGRSAAVPDQGQSSETGNRGQNGAGRSGSPVAEALSRLGPDPVP